MKLVLLIVVATTVFYLIVGVRALVLLATLRGKSGPRRLGVFDRILFFPAAVGLLLLAYGYWIEPRLVRVIEVDLESSKLHADDGFRIVQISDIHSPSNLAVQRRLPELISALQPDVIVFTGDAVNSVSGLAPVQEIFRALAAIAPTFGIMGNHDALLREPVLFDSTGVRELRGDVVTLEHEGDSIAFVGASRQEDRRSVRRSLLSRSADTYTIYVDHSPDYVFDAGMWGADLYLSGHTHGGQVALPIYGALWTASMHGKRFEAGLYQVDSTAVYVNRGIGMAGKFPPIRIGVRPEITLLVIRGSSKGAPTLEPSP